jgi:hypothetical protein
VRVGWGGRRTGTGRCARCAGPWRSQRGARHAWGRCGHAAPEAAAPEAACAGSTSSAGGPRAPCPQPLTHSRPRSGSGRSRNNPAWRVRGTALAACTHAAGGWGAGWCAVRACVSAHAPDAPCTRLARMRSRRAGAGRQCATSKAATVAPRAAQHPRRDPCCWLPLWPRALTACGGNVVVHVVRALHKALSSVAAAAPVAVNVVNRPRRVGGAGLALERAAPGHGVHPREGGPRVCVVRVRGARWRRLQAMGWGGEGCCVTAASLVRGREGGGCRKGRAFLLPGRRRLTCTGPRESACMADAHRPGGHACGHRAGAGFQGPCLALGHGPTRPQGETAPCRARRPRKAGDSPAWVMQHPFHPSPASTRRAQLAGHGPRQAEWQVTCTHAPTSSKGRCPPPPRTHRTSRTATRFRHPGTSRSCRTSRSAPTPCRRHTLGDAAAEVVWACLGPLSCWRGERVRAGSTWRHTVGAVRWYLVLPVTPRELPPRGGGGCRAAAAPRPGPTRALLCTASPPAASCAQPGGAPQFGSMQGALAACGLLPRNPAAGRGSTHRSGRAARQGLLAACCWLGRASSH